MRALLLLKLKKHKEAEADKLDGQLLEVFRMIDDIEWGSINIRVLEALQSGTALLNRLHEEMSLEDVETLLEESAEAVEVSLFI